MLHLCLKTQTYTDIVVIVAIVADHIASLSFLSFCLETYSIRITYLFTASKKMENELYEKDIMILQ